MVDKETRVTAAPRNLWRRVGKRLQFIWQGSQKASQQITLLQTEIQDLQRRISDLTWTSKHLVQPPLHYLPVDLKPGEKELVSSFHKLLYDLPSQAHESLRSYFIHWMGYEMLKWPGDLWIYQECIASMRPSVIIETGTHAGGSALFLASICDLIDHGQVVTVDIDLTHSKVRPRHPRITYLSGSSVDDEIIREVNSIVAGRRDVMVILDADHRCEHVLAELRIYSQFVPPGGLLIVEDSNINGHPAYPEFGPGPWEAIELFLAENSDFYTDTSHERLLLTMNPNGYLRRRFES